MIKQTAKAKSNAGEQAPCVCGHAKDKHVAGKFTCLHWSQALGRYCECDRYVAERKGKGK